MGTHYQTSQGHPPKTPTRFHSGVGFWTSDARYGRQKQMVSISGSLFHMRLESDQTPMRRLLLLSR